MAFILLTIPKYTLCCGTVRLCLLRWNGLDVPDHLGILINTPVTSEETHPSDAGDALRGPFLLILVLLVDEFLCLAVRGKVIRH